MQFDFDLFVIGGGSGGVRAARLAAEKGLRVGMAEESRMGGTCVIRGCVPKKLMLYASEYGDQMRASQGFGWNFENAEFVWSKFHDKLRAELDRLEGVYTNIMDNNGVRLFHDRAVLDDPHHIALASGLRVSAERILIATGGRPFVPQFEGSDLVLTSDDIFDLPSLPQSMAIVGGGYIASEFAGILHGLGAKVTQIYRGDLILRGYDRELRQQLVEDMHKRGITICHNTDIARIEAIEGGRKLHLKNGESLEVEAVLYATGRRANIDGLGLDAAGVTVENGVIKVDQYSQTSQENIYAIGDVTGRAALTPVAIREGVNFIKTVYEGTPCAVDYDKIPTAIFTRPELGTIGLSEERAIELGFDIEVYAANFRPMATSFSGGEERMIMKLVVNRADDKILGTHILGDGAGEMIQLVGIPITMGATKADFDATIAVHPTAAEELVTMRIPRKSK